MNTNSYAILIWLITKAPISPLKNWTSCQGRYFQPKKKKTEQKKKQNPFQMFLNQREQLASVLSEGKANNQLSHSALREPLNMDNVLNSEKLDKPVGYWEFGSGPG